MPKISESTKLQRRRPKAVPEEGPTDQYASKAISRALDVVECFASDLSRFNLKQLSAMVKMPESSLYRILVTLVHRGYLKQEQDGTYQLAPRLLYGKVQEAADRLKEKMQPELRAIAARFNETASLAYLFGTRVQVLDSIEAMHEVRMINRPGRVIGPHCTSLGKAITAFQTPEVIDSLLEVFGLLRRTPNTMVDRRQLMAEYERVRREGYAVDREEAAEGGVCLGAPLASAGERVVGAISVSTPSTRMNPEREREIVAALLEISRKVQSLPL